MCKWLMFFELYCLKTTSTFNNICFTQMQPWLTLKFLHWVFCKKKSDILMTHITLFHVFGPGLSNMELRRTSWISSKPVPDNRNLVTLLRGVALFLRGWLLHRHLHQNFFQCWHNVGNRRTTSCRISVQGLVYGKIPSLETSLSSIIIVFLCL